MTINLSAPKSWVTGLCGIVAAICQLLTFDGVSLGHVGKVTGVEFLSSLAVLGMGLAAKDWNVHGGTVGQPTSKEAKDTVATVEPPK
jgi:hypothetical protein